MISSTLSKILSLLILVDCEWGKFTCGECEDGSRVCNRTIVIEAENYGKECEGEASIKESCPGTLKSFIITISE